MRYVHRWVTPGVEVYTPLGNTGVEDSSPRYGTRVGEQGGVKEQEEAYTAGAGAGITDITRR